MPSLDVSLPKIKSQGGDIDIEGPQFKVKSPEADLDLKGTEIKGKIDMEIPSGKGGKFRCLHLMYLYQRGSCLREILALRDPQSLSLKTSNWGN